jgi:hypothetical protein
MPLLVALFKLEQELYFLSSEKQTFGWWQDARVRSLPAREIITDQQDWA